MFFKHKKFISFLLILCAVFSMCGQALTVFAVESSGLDDENVTTIIPSDNLQDIYFELQAEDVPELIDFNEAKEKGHVQRLREKEPDNNTVIFLNEDSTETMYIFAEPIKYADVNGEIKDKSRTLSLVENNYTMTENDVQVNFPTNVSDGISASKGEYTVSMVPISTLSDTVTTNTTAELVNNTISYTDVFGTADVLYTPLYSGFKEDIILESYNGVNEFNFFVYTNGLIPIKNENGSVSFFDPDTAESVAEMMQVVCYDANNKFAGGDIVITEIKENDIYALTVIADAAFLADENTAYPVSVDPTLSFSGTTAIEDAVVYSGKPNRNYADYSYNNIGYVDSSYKIGELLVKFPTLEAGIFGNLESYQINSATLTLYPASGGSGTEQINAYEYHGTWDESTVNWNGLSFVSPPVLRDTVIIPSGTGATTFNITQTVKNWANSTVAHISPSTGLIFANISETDANKCRDFLSTEYAASHNNTGMPILEIEYITKETLYVAVPSTTLQAGDSMLITAYMIIDGVIHYNNGALLSFNFINPSTGELTYSLTSPDGSLELSSFLSGHLNALKPGFATVHIAYGSNPNIFKRIAITVTPEKIHTGEPAGGYVLDNDGTRICDLNAYVERDGRKLYDGAGDITYSIYDRMGMLNSTFEITNKYTNGSNTEDKVLKVTLPPNHDPLFAHDTGTITILATTPSGASTFIHVEVKCTGAPACLPDQPSGIGLKGGRYIWIPHDNQAGYNNHWELKNMLISRRMSYEDLIEKDFSLNYLDSFWHSYEGSDALTKKFLEYMQKSQVFCLLSHGTASGISMSSSDPNQTLTVSQINQLHNGFFNYCKLVIISSCSSGVDDPTTDYTSMLEAIANKGAGAVMGYDTAVNTEQAHKFEYVFLSCLRTDASYRWNDDHLQTEDTLIEPIGDNNRTIEEAFILARSTFWNGEGYDIEAAGRAKLEGNRIDVRITD
ncbi:MAG: DNRLRE domain-containing protein [Clostridia bacterium]|nr:DNRLRE domain-containing protein [Clostridia bacterium]